MILQASWTGALFNSLTSVNESGNRNIAGFSGVMDFEANLNIKITRLNQPLGFLLVANDWKEVTIIHHPHNFGGTLLRPANKVGCLVGTGPNATPIVLNHRSALQSVQAIVPSITDIGACLRVNALAALTTPVADGLAKLEGLNSFFSAPFLRNAILLADSSFPFALVLTGRAA